MLFQFQYWQLLLVTENKMQIHLFMKFVLFLLHDQQVARG